MLGYSIEYGDGKVAEQLLYEDRDEFSTSEYEELLAYVIQKYGQVLTVRRMTLEECHALKRFGDALATSVDAPAPKR